MASANGYELAVKTRGGGNHKLRAAWAAPYFVLVDNTEKPKDMPLLYHAESLADAKRFARGGNGDFTQILNAKFEPI